MSWIDWAVFLGFLSYVVVDGLRRGRGTTTLEGYFAGGRTITWWAAGLSIMATQASAITVIGTTGQGFESGMEFVQIYFGLAFAMVLLSIFFVPMYRAQPILTAYEFLERRFGPLTRLLASLIFLLSRCLAFGVVLYAPGVVLSALLDFDVAATVIVVGVLTTVYTMFGGVKAVIATDVKQMVVILGGLGLVLVLLLLRIIPEFGFVGGLEVLGATGKLNAVEFEPASWDLIPKGIEESGQSFWDDKYNFWSGMFGGLFLMLSYFGCDQSQVQRILTNASPDESRKALLLSAFAKVPMQAMVLFIGVLLYLFYVLNPAPLLFNTQSLADLKQQPVLVEQMQGIEARYSDTLLRQKMFAKQIAAKGIDGVEASSLQGYRVAVREAKDLRSEARRTAYLATPANLKLTEAEQTKLKTPSDTNFIFPRFILSEVPVFFLGLMMAAIFAAMMSSADSALNSLTSSSIVDIYKRWLRPHATESESLFASRLTTLFWGLSATGAALLFQGSGSVIEVVNRVGSFFYGSLLGVFALGLLVPRAGPVSGFLGLIGGMTAVLVTWQTLSVEFLWFNVIGCLGVLLVGSLTSLLERRH